MAALEDDIERARLRFGNWMRWYMVMYPHEAPSGAALGRRLGITGQAVTQLLDPKGRRFPSFETLVAAKRLTGFSFDALLLTDPPPVPHR